MGPPPRQRPRGSRPASHQIQAGAPIFFGTPYQALPIFFGDFFGWLLFFRRRKAREHIDRDKRLAICASQIKPGAGLSRPDKR